MNQFNYEVSRLIYVCEQEKSNEKRKRLTVIKKKTYGSKDFETCGQTGVYFIGYTYVLSKCIIEDRTNSTEGLGKNEFRITSVA